MGLRGLICGLWIAAILDGQDAPPGTLIEKVACRAKVQQSYALYLPSSYSSTRSWPVLYCVDPMARGRVPVERFRAAAEKLGVIVAGSNNARIGLYGPIAEALQAIVEDTRERFSIDPGRIYAAGFSAAGQAVTHWAQSGQLAGIVLSGSSIDSSALPATASFRVFGAAGLDDFTYYDMRAASVAMAQRELQNRFREFAGGHEWLPADAAEEALRFFSGQLPAAPATESKDTATQIARLDAMVGRISLAGGGPAHRPVTQFRTQPDGTAYPASVFSRNGDSMANVSGIPQDDLLRQTRPEQLIAELLVDSETSIDTPKRRLARQALGSAYMTLSELAGRLVDAGSYREAIRCLEVVVLLRPKDGAPWYSLAVAQSASGNKSKALDALKIAASHGFRDVASLEREPLLNPIRGDRKFASIVQAMGSAKM